jgi:hypothetical protein
LLADVHGHRCLVSAESLPMHLALGSGLRWVSIFTYTSPMGNIRVRIAEKNCLAPFGKVFL